LSNGVGSVKTGLEGGLNFILPDGVIDKEVSVVEVGPTEAKGVATELNRFFGTNIESMHRVDGYVLVHPQNVSGLESLTQGVPFVDPIIHRATLNESLALQLLGDLPFDFVMQSMYRAGTSDSKGNEALRQAMLKLGEKFSSDDHGFYSVQYFLKGLLTPTHQELVSAHLANPEIYSRQIIPREQYMQGLTLDAPIVVLNPDVEEPTFDVANYSREELLALNSHPEIMRLAATEEELVQFAEMYKDEAFQAKRKELGLGPEATATEITTWFGLRSEHCFHKEFNAHITLEDRANDPVFRRAHEKGWLDRNEDGDYVLERGLFNTFIVEPAEEIYKKLEARGNNWIVSMFSDNSGVVLYDPEFMFCIKFETHNSPSNKEPVQGAKTGIDGVNRDIFGTMRGTFDAIANFFLYCTGNPHYKGWLPKGVKHPYTILQGITKGVREGGNESQIPTLGGGAVFDPRYIAKCLVYCGTIGWSPVRAPDGTDYTTETTQYGDIVFVAGQPTGIDGIGFKNAHFRDDIGAKAVR